MMKNIRLKKEQIHEGNLILVNASHPMGTADVDGLVPVNSPCAGVYLRRDAANVLHSIFERIGSGREIATVSGYRTQQEQQTIFDGSLRSNGWEFTKKYVALPGCSEHQTGLAIDLGLNREPIDFIRPYFPNTGACGAFLQTAYLSGFIQRYKKEKEHITGIACEPWHFRYVGHPHSEVMEKENLSLEEYTAYLKDYPYGGQPLTVCGGGKKIEISYIPCPDQELEIQLPEHAVYQLSGNNEDGFVLTVWRCVR